MRYINLRLTYLLLSRLSIRTSTMQTDSIICKHKNTHTHLPHIFYWAAFLHSMKPKIPKMPNFDDFEQLKPTCLYL